MFGKITALIMLAVLLFVMTVRVFTVRKARHHLLINNSRIYLERSEASGGAFLVWIKPVLTADYLYVGDRYDAVSFNGDETYEICRIYEIRYRKRYATIRGIIWKHGKNGQERLFRLRIPRATLLEGVMRYGIATNSPADTGGLRTNCWQGVPTRSKNKRYRIPQKV